MQMRNTCGGPDLWGEGVEDHSIVLTLLDHSMRGAKRVVLIPITDSAQKQRADNRSRIYTLRACDTSRCARLDRMYLCVGSFSFSQFLPRRINKIFSYVFTWCFRITDFSFNLILIVLKSGYKFNYLDFRRCKYAKKWKRN